MVGTITPLVQAARKTWLIVTVAFVSGSIAAAAMLGITLGWIGVSVRRYGGLLELGTTRRGLFLVVLLAATAIQLGWFGIRLPERRRSLSRSWWIERDRRLAALVYGAALGFGLLTHIRFASYFVVLSWIALFGAPESGALVLGIYGLARATTIAATGLPIWNASDPWQETVNLRRSIVSKLLWVERVNAAALILVGVAWLIGSAVSVVAAN